MSSFEEFNNINITNKTNSNIIDQFIKYYQFVYSNYSVFKKTSREIFFKLNAIKKNIYFLASFKKTIVSGEQLEKYKGVGTKTVEKINQIINDGYIHDIKNFNEQSSDNSIKIIQELSSIYGIGPTKASAIYKKYGITSINDLIKKYKSGKIKLTDQMLLGIKYRDFLITKIPIILILQLDIYVSKLVNEFDKNFIIVFCGSYRRGKEYPGDVDILITHKNLNDVDNCKEYLEKIVNLLNNNIVIDPLTENYNTHFQAFGTFKNLVDLPKSYDKNDFNVKLNVFKIDIIIVPIQSFYTALMHFTGSGDFNKKIRIHAKSMNMKINEYGLFKITGDKETNIPIKSEKDIFDNLLLKYLPPDKRY
jgi:DNA polymerase/3'-5' exonuclease PolX